MNLVLGTSFLQRHKCTIIIIIGSVCGRWGGGVWLWLWFKVQLFKTKWLRPQGKLSGVLGGSLTLC